MGTKVQKANTSSKKRTKKAVEAVETYPRPQYVFGGQKITKVATSNPSREGTKAHDNWAMIKNGMTVEKYLEKGGSIKDLRANLHRGNIELK